MPADSKLDPPWAEAKSSNSDSSSGIMHFRNGKRPHLNATAAAGERKEKMWKKGACMHPGQWGRRGEGAPGAWAEVLLQATEQTEAAETLPSMEDHGGATTHLQPRKDFKAKQVDVPEGGCDPTVKCQCAAWNQHADYNLRQKQTKPKLSNNRCDHDVMPKIFDRWWVSHWGYCYCMDQNGDVLHTQTQTGSTARRWIWFTLSAKGSLMDVQQ